MGAMNHSTEQREVPARAKRQHFSWFSGQMEEKIHFELTWIENFSIFPVKQKVEKKLMADCFLFSASFYFLFHYFLQLLSGEVSEPVLSLPTYRFVVGEKPSFAQNYFARWWKFGWASQKWELSVLRGGGGSISAESWPHILGGTPFSPAFGTAGDAATPRGIPAENWLRKKISQFWLLELSMRWLGLETSLNGSKPDQASGNSFPLLCLGCFCAKAADFLTPKCLVNPCWCPWVSHFKIFQSI